MQEAMVVTCMQKGVKIKSLQNAMEVNCKHMLAEEGEHQVQLNAGSHGGHLHADGRARGGS